jgi:hypothetical protein
MAGKLFLQAAMKRLLKVVHRVRFWQAAAGLLKPGQQSVTGAA